MLTLLKGKVDKLESWEKNSTWQYGTCSKTENWTWNVMIVASLVVKCCCSVWCSLSWDQLEFCWSSQHTGLRLLTTFRFDQKSILSMIVVTRSIKAYGNIFDSMCTYRITIGMENQNILEIHFFFKVFSALMGICIFFVNSFETYWNWKKRMASQILVHL